MTSPISSNIEGAPNTDNGDDAKSNKGITAGTDTTTSGEGGLTLSLNATPQFIQYPFKLEHNAFHIMASIRAPYFRNEKERAPIDLICCIDKSGSMSGERITLVRKTVTFVIKNLQHNDRFGCVAYSSASRVVIPLTKMDQYGKTRALKAVGGISASGCTALCAGLCQSIDLLRRRKKSNEISSVMLFTDGEANRGPSNTLEIVQAMNNPNWFKKHAQDDTTSKNKILKDIFGIMRDLIGLIIGVLFAVGFVIFLLYYFGVLSSGFVSMLFYSFLVALFVVFLSYVYLKYGDTMVSRLPSMPRRKCSFIVNTFGFGEGHNASLLEAIAENGRGMYAFIDDPKIIAETFGECLGGLVSMIGRDLNIRIEALGDNSINDCLSKGYEMNVSVPKKDINIKISDIQTEESRDLVLQLTVPKLSKACKTYGVARISMKYYNVVNGEEERVSVVCNIDRSSDSCECIGETNIDLDIQCNRLIVAQAMEKADALAESGSLDKARKVLENAKKDILKSRSAKHDYCKSLITDINECVSHLQSTRKYKSSGTKVLKSNTTSHYHQRSSQSKRYSSQAYYSTYSKKKMVSKFA